MSKTRRPFAADPLSEWREALRRDAGLTTAVCHHNGHSCTSLHLMADRLYDPVVSLQLAALLLEHGADPNAQTDFGWTPLHFACHVDAREEAMVLLLLRSGADPNLTDSRGETPLHYALGASDESRRIVALLLKHGAFVDLDAAVRLGDVKRVRGFLRRGGLSQSRNPRELLRNAIYSGSAATVELLLRHGADPNQKPKNCPEPPLYTASSEIWGNEEMVRLLLEYGADPNPTRYKPLTVAKMKKPNMSRIVELLVKAGAIDPKGRRTHD